MRGIYASLQTTNIGGFQLPAIKQNIISNNANQNALISYITDNFMRSISIYDLNAIFADPTLSKNLANFIHVMKSWGVVDINATVAATQHVDAAMNFNKKYPGSFTGLLTEFEFWSPGGGTFDQFLSLLDYMKPTGLISSCYLGWLKGANPPLMENSMAAQIARRVNRIYLHAYVNDPANAFPYVQDRINALISTGVKLQLAPIFSAESISTDGANFMGSWLSLHHKGQAEKIFLDAYEAAYPNSNNLSIIGFQYYEYGFLGL